ncbi:universal stress protein [Variovorax saccharolyticus]|uniref:universal stress protein n=1 Tax=Variovorax saccharolyticus TaxID=3053516 RepID=UPI002576ADDA|nr:MULTISPECIES: universal stress protein [unclassified Variovorax]MDM0020334.1 universal stress protein [Variovorax sp. J22R187]MDM0023969.1 universal stress protein [Variovorax sp. J31P216]
MYQRILVATDGSELSEQAVTSAIDLALLTQSELFAVKVSHHQSAGYFEGSLLLNQMDAARLRDEADAESQRVVDAVKDKADARGVKKTTGIVVRSEGVSEAIIDAARVHQCDLIVMASHGRRGIRRLLMGSETLHVLTHSHTPVLVLR